MRSRTYTVLGIISLIALCALVCLFEIRQANALRAEVNELTARNRELASALRKSKVARQPAQDHSFVTNPTSAKSPSLLNSVLTRFDDPKISKLMASSFRAQVARRFAGFISGLNLGSATSEQLIDLLVDRQMARLDVVIAANKAGMADPVELGRAEAQAQLQIESRIQSLLGDAFPQFQSYQSSLTQRTIVAQVQQELTFSGTPLTKSQIDQLALTLSDTGPGARGTVTWTPGHLDTAPNPNGVITNATIMASRPFLMPDQVQALEEVRQVQNANMRTGQLVRRSAPAQVSISTPRAAAPSGRD